MHGAYLVACAMFAYLTSGWSRSISHSAVRASVIMPHSVSGRHRTWADTMSFCP